MILKESYYHLNAYTPTTITSQVIIKKKTKKNPKKTKQSVRKASR